MTKDPFHILINKNAGTVITMGQEKLEQLIADSNLPLASVIFAAPEDFQKHLKHLSGTPNPVLVGGGDGTITHTAVFSIKHGTAFGILPLGTMNMVACDLGIPTDFAEALQAYKNNKPIKIDYGSVNDNIFLCAASIGVIPEASKYREKIRGDLEMLKNFRIGAFVFNELHEIKSRNIRLKLDNKTKKVKTNMVIISNNPYDVEVHGQRLRFIAAMACGF